MFKPELDNKKKIVPQREILSLHLPPELSEQLKTAVQKTGLKKQELVRQMILHCINTLDMTKEF